MAGHGDQGAIGAIGGQNRSSQADVIAQLKKHQEIQHGAHGAVVAHAQVHPNSIWTANAQC